MHCDKSSLLHSLLWCEAHIVWRAFRIFSAKFCSFADHPCVKTTTPLYPIVSDQAREKMQRWSRLSPQDLLATDVGVYCCNTSRGSIPSLDVPCVSCRGPHLANSHLNGVARGSSWWLAPLWYVGYCFAVAVEAASWPTSSLNQHLSVFN